VICDYCGEPADHIIRYEARTPADPKGSFAEPSDAAVCNDHLDLYRRAFLNDGARVQVLRDVGEPKT